MSDDEVTVETNDNNEEPSEDSQDTYEDANPGASSSSSRKKSNKVQPTTSSEPTISTKDAIVAAGVAAAGATIAAAMAEQDNESNEDDAVKPAATTTATTTATTNNSNDDIEANKVVIEPIDNIEEEPKKEVVVKDLSDLKVGMGQRRRRRIRFFTLAVICGAIIFFWWVNGAVSLLPLTVKFKDQLVVVPTGCDTYIRKGSKDQVTVIGLRSRGVSFDLQFKSNPTDELKNLIAKNVQCSDLPGMNCSHACRILIDVKDGSNPDIQVIQPGTDKAARIIVSVEKGVSLSALKLRGPSVELVATEAAVTGHISAWLNGGRIMAKDVAFGSADLRSTKNSVYVIDSGRRNVTDKITYRTPEHRACIRATGAGTVTPDPDPWSECSFDNSFYTTKTISLYDTNRDFRVDQDEFLAGLTKLPRCCGRFCPLRSLCGGLAGDVFPVTVGSTARSGILSDGEFLANLKALNDTSLVPLCLRRVTVTPSSVYNAPSRNLKIIADGEVRVVRPQPEGDLATVATDWSPGGAQTGLNILQQDADQLMDIRDKYGDLSAIEHLYLVMDVEEGYLSPPGRWIWSTREVYLNLDPVHLQALSIGLLVPKIQYVKVRFTNGYCDDQPRLLSNATTEEKAAYEAARRVEQYTALANALTPRGQLFMRGQLVRLESNHTPTVPVKTMFVRDFATGEITMQPMVVGDLTLTQAVVYLSLGIGGLFGFIVTISFFVCTRARMHQLQRAAEVKEKLMMLEAGIDPKTVEVDSKAVSKTRSALSNPFVYPFQVIDIFIITPLRQKMVNSLNQFVLQRCAVLDAEERMEPENSDVQLDMDVFDAAYSQFCYQQGLAPVVGNENITQLLIKDYDLRVRQTNHRRLRGVVWKDISTDKEDVMRDSASLTHLLEADTLSLLREFNERYIDITLNHSDSIEYKSTKLKFVTGLRKADHDTKVVNNEPRGYREVFQDFCNGFDRLTPEITPDQLEQLGIKISNQKLRMIRGLRLLDFEGGEVVKLDFNWYFLQFVSVVIHMLVLFAVPLVMINVALSLQFLYVQTTGLGAPVTEFDLMTFPPNVSGKTILIESELIIIIAFCMLGLAVFRLLTEYAQLNPGREEGGTVAKIINYGYAFFLVIVFFLITSYASVFGVWLLLAALLDPTNFLPQGAAVVAVVVLGSMTYKKLRGTAVTIRKKFKEAMKKFVQKTLDTTKRLMDETQKQSNESGRQVAAGQDDTKTTSVEESGETDLGDLFTMLNLDGDENLDFDEFCQLFDKLGFNVSDLKRAQMFAYADKDGSGEISVGEFEQAWSYLEEEMMDSALESMGISDSSIIFIVLSLVVMTVLVFVFLFLAMAVWSNGGSFEAVIQTFLVSGTGAAMSFARSQPAAEKATDDELDGAVSDNVATLG